MASRHHADAHAHRGHAYAMRCAISGPMTSATIMNRDRSSGGSAVVANAGRIVKPKFGRGERRPHREAEVEAEGAKDRHCFTVVVDAGPAVRVREGAHG